MKKKCIQLTLWLAFAICFRADATSVTITIVNAGYDLGFNFDVSVFWIDGDSSSTFLQAYTAPPAPGASKNLTVDDIYAYHHGSVGCASSDGYGHWIPGTTALYSQGDGGSVTLYIFPGGTNSSVYTPPPPPPAPSPKAQDGNDLAGAGGGSRGGGCPTCGCEGMPEWQISEPFISLWLSDEPLGYQPAVGARISFNLNFKQRESTVGFNPNFSSVGKKWTCSWLSYLAQDSHGTNTIYFPGGGSQSFNATSNYLTNTRLTGNTNSGFTLLHPDGSQEIYAFIVTNASGGFQNAFMSQQINAKGQTNTFNYFPYTPGSSPVVRLATVVDGDGRTNSVYYNSASAFSTNLITAVVDPFGRTNMLAYDNTGQLTNSIDTAGLASSFGYDANGWVTNSVTPYGTNSFTISDGTNSTYLNGRSVLIGRPDGSHELYLYKDYATGAASSDSAPDTTPFANTFDTTQLNLRNSYYWGPRQYLALSSTSAAAFTAADFLKARMKHWLLDPNVVDGTGGAISPTVSIERDPSPDSAGTIEGQKTWYDYSGKPVQLGTTFPFMAGIQSAPLFVAKALPDTTTWFERTDRNILGKVVTKMSTYSGGTRTEQFGYDSSGIDLITITNALGVLVSSNAYNPSHEVISHFNALGELTSYTYDANHQVSSIALPTGLVTTNIYGTTDLLVQQIVLGFSTNVYSYTNSLILSHTDERGLTTTNTWDGLNRLTSTIFQDGSYVSNIYSRLDLTATKDRMSNWTRFAYDALRRNTAMTNALNQITHYNYCTCGSLDSVLDAENNLTQFFYDNQGNLTRTSYADGYSVTNTYDLLRRMVATKTSGGNNTTNTYNNQGLVTTIKNTAGTLASYTYDILDRLTTSVDANGVSVNTTFDNQNRPVTRSYPDGGTEGFGYTFNVAGQTRYTNQIKNVASFAYDALGRKTNEVSVGVMTNGFAYDGAGDLLRHLDGRNQATTWRYDEFARVTNKVDALGVVDFVYQYDANSRLTNRWTPAKGNTVYTYDAVGNRTNVSHIGAGSIAFAYDGLNRLTNMVDELGTNRYVYDAAGGLLSAGGLWTGDTVAYAYTNRMRGGLTVGSWTQTYDYDQALRLTNIMSSAGGFAYDFDAWRHEQVARLRLPSGGYVTNRYDLLARLTGTDLRNSSNNVLDGNTYTYDLLGQRTNVVRDYGLTRSSATSSYDAIGELTRWTAQESGGAIRLNEQFGYAYDAAQNLRQRTNNQMVQTFSLDAANELSGVARSGLLTVSGSTPLPASSVTVNGQPAFPYGDFTFASSNGLVLNDGQTSFTNLARNYYGTVSVTNTVNAYLPENVTLQYDANGNLTNDGLRSFAYDTENQLTNVSVAGQWRQDYLYDGLNRRRITRKYLWQSSMWVLTNETRFVYDGNLPIQEWSSNNVLQVSYVRGLDFSGTLQRAGGIGGLLARIDSSCTVYYHADGNGNITSLMDTNQFVVARYLYEPFGKLLGKWGILADANVYRFSSKAFDASSGLYYYLYRFCDPNLQRWLNRDPLASGNGLQKGTQIENAVEPSESWNGDNLYHFVYNNPIGHVDIFGLDIWLVRSTGWPGHEWIIGNNPDGTYWDSNFHPDTKSGWGLNCKGKVDFNDKSGFDPNNLGPDVRVVTHVRTSSTVDANLKQKAKEQHDSPDQPRYDALGHNCRTYCTDLQWSAEVLIREGQ